MADGNQATAVPKVETLAFFTTGDTRPTTGIPRNAPSAAKLSSSQRYEKRAASLASAGRVHGVDSVRDATAVLKALPSDVKLVKVFFVGHGFDDGFFFHGRPDPSDPENFFADTRSETLQDPGKVGDAAVEKEQKEFIAELTKHLHPTEPIEIGLLSCYTGIGSTVRAVGRAIHEAKFKEYRVGSYKNFYETRYTYDTKSGAVRKWIDGLLDKEDTRKVLVRMDNNQIPPYETECGQSNDPLSSLFPC